MSVVITSSATAAVPVATTPRLSAVETTPPPTGLVRNSAWPARAVELRTTRVWQHIGVYAYAREALAQWVSLPPHPLERIERLEQLRPLAAGLAMGVALINERPRIGIDTAADLTRANADWNDFEEHH